MSRFVLAIDQGTTSSRAVIFDDRAEVVGVGQLPFAQHFPRPGWVEHDPEEIWTSTQAAVGAALDQARLRPADLAAIGIANQRETVVIWDRLSGAAIGRALVWQDRRTAGLCEALAREGHESTVAERTGLTLDPYFSGTKLGWLLARDPALRDRARRGEIAAGTVDSWLIWRLTGGRVHLTDFTNASRTLLYNVVKRRWDEDLAAILDVPLAMMPEVRPSLGHFAETDAAVFGAETPILGVAGDQQAALFGQACFDGQAKQTYGTGAFLLASTGDRPGLSGQRLLLSLGARSGERPEYVLEGSLFNAGSVVQWLRDELGLFERSADIEPLAASVPDSAGVVLVPAFTGLGAPHWDPHARGTIVGLTRGAGRAHIARAALEAVALSSCDLLAAMQADLGREIDELRVDGGMARNDLLMQMQADLAGIPVVRPAEIETTALGAAFLAGIGAGVWSSEEEVAALWRPDRRFEPALPAKRRAERMDQWRRALERSFNWARDA